MSEEGIEHANADTYAKDVKAALDDFEEALTKRYKNDLDDRLTVWTPNGEKPEGDVWDPNDRDTRPELVFERLKNSAPEWAAEVRALVEPRTKECATQDLGRLKYAFNSIYEATELLGEPDAKDEESPDLGDDGLPSLTDDIAALSNYEDEFAAWAGIAGEQFKNSFGKYVNKTRRNQRDIAVSLANLYSARMSTIEAVRRNMLRAIRGATEAIAKTQDSGAEESRWFAVSVVGIGVGIASAGLGTAFSIGALLGQLKDNQSPDQEYTEDIEDVASKLVSKVDSTSSEGLRAESQISLELDVLQGDISGVPIAELELYDFTGHDGHSSSPPEGGFDVSVDKVEGLSQDCFEASQVYEDIITKVVETESADGHLKGVYDDETPADTKLKETRDASLRFLQSTCARYHEAGCRLADAARTYFEVETDNEQILKGLDREPDLNGETEGEGGSVDDHLGESDREDLHDGDDANDSNLPERER